MHRAAILLPKHCAPSAHLHGNAPTQQRTVDNRASLPTRCRMHCKRRFAPGAQRQQSAPASQHDTSVSSSDPSSWSQRMASIQKLMNKVQEQMQQHDELQSNDLALAKKLKSKSEQHLNLLMQLAEAEQRHISGDMESEELQQVLRDLQQQLDQEQQEALAALEQHANSSHADDSSSNSSSSEYSRKQLRVEKHSEQLGATAELKEVIHRASEGLNRKRQELLELSQQTDVVEAADTAAAAEHHTMLLEIHDRVEAAEASVHSTQQLLQDYDLMCQKAFELSRKLSLAESENKQLRSKLAHVKEDLAAAADELAEHRELQMVYDKQCQDMYRLRMLLQQTQAAGHDVAAQAAGTASKYKKDVAWLMEEHRRELSEQYIKNQELTESIQELRMRLLELEQQLWSQDTAGSSSSSTEAAATSVQQTQQAAADEQQPQQQSQQVHLVFDSDADAAVQQLTQEKQQLMKSLQDLQRQQAVLLMELQASQQQLAADSQNIAAAAVEQQAADEAREAVISLQHQLEQSAEQRDALIQQVQALQQDLQEARAAADAISDQQAAVSVASTADSTALAAAEQELADMKAEVVQLRAQLAQTRRELQAVTGRVTAAESALQQQATAYESRLQQLQTLYSKQTAVVARLRQGKAPPPDAVGFKNTNRFWVPQQLMYEFLKHWVMREGQLQQQPGFLGLQVDPVPGVSADGGVDVVISSVWESIPLWEAWSKSDAGRQQHMPVGVYQYVPKKGEGFPEDFVPFRDYDEAVIAKY